MNKIYKIILKKDKQTVNGKKENKSRLFIIHFKKPLIDNEADKPSVSTSETTESTAQISAGVVLDLGGVIIYDEKIYTVKDNADLLCAVPESGG